jgi:selenide,water dikinase
MGREDDLLPFRPQRDYLKLISLGSKRALAEKGGLVGAGSVLWRWKDRIDQRFMDKFRDLSPMASPRLPRELAKGVRETLGDKPMCGGCGAKLGPGSLKSSLSTLPSGTRTDVLSRPGDDAAVLQIGATRQILTTDHLRGFTIDHALQARIAAIHALGDCWAMGAEPQAALATLILPRLSADLQARWMAEIMAEAAAVFAAEGAEIVGGHSSMGDELTIGFTVTGLLDGPAITLAGARPGDRLLLTKALGTGVILAAEMQLRAPGGVVAGAWDQMATSSGDAARILAPHATAMTDVTGFGLAGHLLNICEASGVAARLDQTSVPVLPGATALLATGLRSTIHGANEAAVLGALNGLADPILFDPQTAGGLLAAVPADKANQLMRDFQLIGVPVTEIGEITDGSPRIDLR